MSGYLGQLLMTLSQPKVLHRHHSSTRSQFHPTPHHHLQQTEFGEMSLLSKGGVRNTSAVVSEQSTLLIVPDAVYQVRAFGPTRDFTATHK